MKRILVCVDGSEASGRALELAVKLALPSGAQVAVAQVRPQVVHPLEGDCGAVVEPEAEEAEDVLARHEAARAKALGVDAVWSLLSGEPAEAIAEAAEAQDCDLVAVANCRHGVLARALLGSLPERLMQLCRRPVLVVH